MPIRSLLAFDMPCKNGNSATNQILIKTNREKTRTSNVFKIYSEQKRGERTGIRTRDASIQISNHVWSVEAGCLDLWSNAQATTLSEYKRSSLRMSMIKGSSCLNRRYSPDMNRYQSQDQTLKLKLSGSSAMITVTGFSGGWGSGNPQPDSSKTISTSLCRSKIEPGVFVLKAERFFLEELLLSGYVLTKPEQQTLKSQNFIFGCFAHNQSALTLGTFNTKQQTASNGGATAFFTRAYACKYGAVRVLLLRGLKHYNSVWEISFSSKKRYYLSLKSNF